MENILDTLLIGGLPVSLIVIGIVAIAKKLGLSQEWWPWFNGGVSALLGGLALYLVPQFPEIKPYLEAVTTLLSIFLASSGIYQLSKVTKVAKAN